MSSRILQYKGVEPLSQQAGQGLIYREMLRQASMLSFNDVFRAVSTIILCVIPLVLLMRRGKTDAPAGHALGNRVNNLVLLVLRSLRFCRSSIADLQ